MHKAMMSLRLNDLLRFWGCSDVLKNDGRQELGKGVAYNIKPVLGWIVISICVCSDSLSNAIERAWSTGVIGKLHMKYNLELRL